MPFDSTDFPKTTPVFTDDWRRAYHDAADYLQKNGWIQRGPYREACGPRVCAVGAVATVTGRDAGELHKNQDVAGSLLFPLLRFIGGYDIPAWNDAPERTAEEVISTLRKCAMEG